MPASPLKRPCGGGPTFGTGTWLRRASATQGFGDRSSAAAGWVWTLWESRHEAQPSRVYRAELPAVGVEPGPFPPGALTPIGASEKSLLSSFRDLGNLIREKQRSAAPTASETWGAADQPKRSK